MGASRKHPSCRKAVAAVNESDGEMLWARNSRVLPKEQKRKRRGIRKVAFEGAARVGPYTTSGMSASLVRLATDTTTFYEQLTELQWKAEFYTHSESECITLSCNICVVIWADCGCDCPDVTGCCCITYQACQSAATERPHHVIF